jgi:hypothetical protein
VWGAPKTHNMSQNKVHQRGASTFVSDRYCVVVIFAIHARIAKDLNIDDFLFLYVLQTDFIPFFLHFLIFQLILKIKSEKKISVFITLRQNHRNRIESRRAASQRQHQIVNRCRRRRFTSPTSSSSTRDRQAVRHCRYSIARFFVFFCKSDRSDNLLLINSRHVFW